MDSATILAGFFVMAITGLTLAILPKSVKDELSKVDKYAKDAKA